MSPTTGIQASQLQQLIQYHLDNELVDNANFLAGRLLALDPRSPDSNHLLALTYLRLRCFQAAFDYSQKHGANGKHLGCAYIFAQACLELGRHTEGVKALESARAQWHGKSEWEHPGSSRRFLPDAPAVLTLQAKLWNAHGDTRKAGDCFVEAHKLNPFIWDAFEGLCKLGADLKVEDMFRSPADVPESLEVNSGPTQIYVDEDSRPPLAPHSNYGQPKAISTVGDPFGPVQPGRKSGWPLKLTGSESDAVSNQTFASDWDTPTTATTNLDLDDDVSMGGVQVENDDVFGEPPAAPSRRPRYGEAFEASDRSRQPSLRGHAMQSVPEGMHGDSVAASRKPSLGGQKRNISGQIAPASTDSGSQPRRSNRLFTQTTSTRTTRSAVDLTGTASGRGEARAAKVATGTRGRTGTVGRVVSGNRKVMPPSEMEKGMRAASRNSNKSATAPTVIATAVMKEPPTVPQVDHQAEEAMSSLLDNFRHLAVGSYALSRFQIPTAIHTFQEASGRDTPWVLAQMGRAHYEGADYKKSEACFARLLKIQPSRIEDMDLYSSVLWHLRKEPALSHLCHLLRDEAFDAPQTWVAVGNAFSLAREHDQAISAFKRATQLADSFAYAWTLMGHEYIANEAYDAALGAFRRAVSADRRGYNGWYGLGRTYERMGKLEDAEKHYRIAAMINPSNATLLVCIGVVLERLRKKGAALANYSRALELQPGSALARFKKSRVLMQLKQFEQALDELVILRDQAPDEANVWFLLGKCYKGLKQRSEALRALTTALNLDAKAAPFIKEAMETLDDEDGSDDD